MTDRRYTDHRLLADEIVLNPAYYGVNPFVPGPCCDRSVQVSFHPHVVSTMYADAEEALVYLRGLTNAVERLIRLVTADPVSYMDSGPCEGCVVRGDVDPAWLAAKELTLVELQAEVLRERAQRATAPRPAMSAADSMAIGDWLDDHGVPWDAR